MSRTGTGFKRRVYDYMGDVFVGALAEGVLPGAFGPASSCA
jgi:hypothetical protein